MPTATDLVTDLPADFAVFGQGVDTSMAGLLGGTTGQVLSKTSGTNMAFTWVTPEIGDITAVNTTAPLTGGGTTGALTLAVNAGSTSAAGVLQITDSTSSTSTTTAASPNSVKTSYDLANAAIPKSTFTTSGDLIQATGSGTFVRLGTGTSGQYLTTNGTTNSWGTIATGAYTLLSTTTLSTGTTTVSSISQSYQDLMIMIYGLNVNSAGTLTFKFRDNTPSDLSTLINGVYSDASTTIGTAQFSYFGNLTSRGTIQASQSDNNFSFVLKNYTQTTARRQIIYVGQFQSPTYSNRTQSNSGVGTYGENTMSEFSITTSAGAFTAGTMKIWGLK